MTEQLKAKPGDIVFAGGNKFRLFTVPILVGGNYYVDAYRYIKSRREFSKKITQNNLGPHYEIVEEG